MNLSTPIKTGDEGRNLRRLQLVGYLAGTMFSAAAFRRVVAVTVLCVFAAPSVGGEPETPKPRSAERLEFFQNKLKKQRLIDPADKSREFVFREKPLVQFDNPVSQIADGFVFAWTDRGRPVAVMKSYYNTPRASWGRTYVSLASGPIRLIEENKPLWSPADGGLSFRPLADVPVPAAQPRLRLTQMRELASRFKVVDNWGLKDPTDWNLRLLTTPLHRYELPEEGVVDGALFGYVLTTSPEALVLLEARESEEGLRWHYAVARCTRFQVTFFLGDQELAMFPRLDAWPPTGTYFHSPVPLPDYPLPKASD